MDAEKRRDLHGHTVLCPNHKTYSSLRLLSLGFKGFGLCCLASPARFERAAFRLGEPLNICHLCSPMYRKVAIRQAFFVFRVAPCSSKFTGVVRCSPVHFSSFLDFSKKGNKNIFHLPPILALFRAKTHLQSNRESKQNISHLPEMYSLGKMIISPIGSMYVGRQMSV